MEFQIQAQVTFKLIAETQFEEIVYLTGDTDALGNWSPENAVQLFTVAESYPCWSTSIPIRLPLPSEIQYKYFFVFENEIRWESIVDNRKIRIIHKKIEIEDTENQPISKVRCILEKIPRDFFSHKQTFEVDSSIKFEDTDSVLIISQELPITAKFENGDWTFQQSVIPWTNHLLTALIEKGIAYKWVGFPGIFLEEEKQNQLSAIYREKFSMAPVFLEKEEYDQFCKYSQYLHEVFSYTMSNTLEVNSLWASFKSVSYCYVAVALNEINEEVVWIHDYPMFLVPSILSKRSIEALNIGFHLHSTFPSSEAFRTLVHKQEILNAICCSDLISFNLFKSARHFITTTKRMLDVDTEIKKGYFGLNYCGRHILLSVQHSGIEPKYIDEILHSERYQDYLLEYSEKYAGYKLVLGIDCVNSLPIKLKSIENAIKKDKKQILYFLDISPSKLDVNSPQFEVLTEEMNEYLRFALMSIANAICVAPFNDTMSLMFPEFISLHSHDFRWMIQSELTESSHNLSSVLKVNPMNIEDITNAFVQTTKKVPPEMKARRATDLSSIMQNTTSQFVARMLGDVKKAKKHLNKFQYASQGLGDNLKLVAFKHRFKRLYTPDVVNAYKNSKNRVLLFSDEGTLFDLNLFENYNRELKPSKMCLKCLFSLCMDEKNTVFIVSAQERSILDKWFSQVDNLGLAAEYGAFERWGSDWKTLKETHEPWFDIAIQVMRDYQEKTEGSVLIVKESSVSFIFRGADPDLGFWQARELVSSLELMLRVYVNDCEIYTGVGCVEVKPRSLSKGGFCYSLFERLFVSRGELDFALAIGSDSSDEDMFRFLKNIQKSSSYILSKVASCFTITVGAKQSNAASYMMDVQEVIRMMDELATYK